jgi:hypothetical protein
MLGVICRSSMHRVYVGLLISIPVGRVLLLILRNHMLLIVRLILVMRPHGRWHGCVRTIMPPLWRLHRHGMLPIRMVILLHRAGQVAFRIFFARTWC